MLFWASLLILGPIVFGAIAIRISLVVEDDRTRLYRITAANAAIFALWFVVLYYPKSVNGHDLFWPFVIGGVLAVILVQIALHISKKRER